MSTYKVTKPQDQYTVQADNKDDARKIVLERENIEIEKVTTETSPFQITDLRRTLPYTKSVGTNNKTSINKVVIHHDGQFRPNVYDSVARYKAQARYHIGKGYGHISYHYKIDNIGEVFQCLSTDDRAYHAGSWSNWNINSTSIAICFDGNMDVQQLTQAQIESYKKLMVYLTTQRPDLPKVLKGSELGHKEVYGAKTACPGRATMPIIHNY